MKFYNNVLSVHKQIPFCFHSFKSCYSLLSFVIKVNMMSFPIFLILVLFQIFQGFANNIDEPTDYCGMLGEDDIQV